VNFVRKKVATLSHQMTHNMEVKVSNHHLEQFPLFEGISSSVLEKLAAVTTLRTRPSNMGVYFPGDNADSVYLLKEGRMKIGNLSSDGREILKMIVNPGQLFGEMALAGETIRGEFALPGKIECSYYVIRVADMKQAMIESSELSMRVLQGMGNRAHMMEKRMESYIFQDSRSRIIDFMLTNADATGKKNDLGVMFFHYMTHQDIANITGTSRQFVTGVMNGLRRSGYIGFNRASITVKNRKGLEKEMNTEVAEHV
jgi:CRP/FNR family cyclic AMP-dependent transcriptional regulator